MEIVDLREIPNVIPTIAKWHHEQWAYLNPQTGLEKRIERYREYLGEKLVPSTYVACRDTTVLGSAAIVKHDMTTRTEYSPWLASVYVHPEHRGRGIGSRLVSHVMAVAEINGFENLYLFTPDRERFYRRLGWSPLHNELYVDAQVAVMAVKFY